MTGILDWFELGWPSGPLPQLIFSLCVIGEPNSAFGTFGSL